MSDPQALESALHQLDEHDLQRRDDGVESLPLAPRSSALVAEAASGAGAAGVSTASRRTGVRTIWAFLRIRSRRWWRKKRWIQASPTREDLPVRNMIAVGCLSLTVAACATMSAQQFNDDMATWLGANEVELYRGFGEPSGEYVMPNSNRVLFWNRYEGSEVDSSAIAAGGTFVASASGQSVARDRTCHIEFELDQQTKQVVSWRSRGTYCRDEYQPD
jgi:hypothetical protein